MVTRRPSRMYPSSGDPLHEHLGICLFIGILPDCHDPGNLDIPCLSWLSLVALAIVRQICSLYITAQLHS